MWIFGGAAGDRMMEMERKREYTSIYDWLDARFDMDLARNKLAAVALVALTIPCVVLEGNATATVLMALIAVPMFLSREPWFV